MEEIFAHHIRGHIFKTKNLDEAIQKISEIYKTGLSKIRDSFNKNFSTPIEGGYPTYPFVGCFVPEEFIVSDPSPSFGVLTEAGFYGTTLTHIDLFKDYLTEQLKSLLERYPVELYIGESFDKIPLPYAVKDIKSFTDAASILNPQKYVMPNLTRINDNIPNGMEQSGIMRPLALFTAERIDFSLLRLEHYTGTSIEHFQKFIVFINYQRYVEPFLKYGIQKLKESKLYTSFIGPDDQEINEEYLKNMGTLLWQMPAYHLKAENNEGITFINIGVGPSNAKNITDHLAVLRPHCWLMLGHCAGLRHSQILGDYVLAHAYVREDHVLDDDLPSWIPIPSLAEIQVALEKAVSEACNTKDIKRCLRTGTIITVSDRNWELKTKGIYERFKKTRAIAVDMESATIAANGFRLRVPYGTLLCVSDKPIHGEIKIRGVSTEFYKQRIQQHLEIGIKTIENLRADGFDKLHSRKLRGFDDPPFR